MTEFLAGAAGEMDALSFLELAAFLLGVAYLVLAIRESIWCWLCAFLSSSIFTGLFAGAQIYMDSALQVFYAIMAIYGWWVWRVGKGTPGPLPVTRWPLAVHAAAIAAVIALSAVTGRFLETFTDAAYPYVDSFTTFASLWTTFLVARKVLENWWYWLVIDAVSVAIYLARGLEFAALLFIIYLVMIPFGLLAWTRSYRELGEPGTAS